MKTDGHDEAKNRFSPSNASINQICSPINLAVVTNKYVDIV